MTGSISRAAGRKGRVVRVGGADGFDAYVALPADNQGPGVVLLHDRFGMNACFLDLCDEYAEEDYVVLAPDMFGRNAPGTALSYGGEDAARADFLAAEFDVAAASRDVSAAILALKDLPEMTGKTGIIGYGIGGLQAVLAASRGEIAAAVAYDPAGIENHFAEIAAIEIPLGMQFAIAGTPDMADTVARLGEPFVSRPDVRIHEYPECDPGFQFRRHPSYDKRNERIGHTRALEIIRREIGRVYNYEALFAEHVRHEFDTRDADATMATMVGNPYVNHVPTMTGGVGHDLLKRFYKYHFIPNNPKDRTRVQISFTEGVDRLVVEHVGQFTHDCEVQQTLPGVAPTGKFVQMPSVLVVNFRGGKVCHEHIYWDQAGVLVQIGLLDPTGLPVAGAQQAAKILDETLPSNELMPSWHESEGKPL